MTLQEFAVELQRFVLACGGNQAAAEQLHRAHLIGLQSQARAIVFDGLIETALVARHVAETEAGDALEAGCFAEHRERRLGLFDLAVFEQHLAEQVPRTVQFGRQGQRIARGLFAECAVAAQDQGAGQRELHAGILGREFGRAAQVGQRLVDVPVIEQQPAQARDRVGVVLVGTQRGAEQGFGLGQVVVDDGDARKEGVCAGLVGIAPDGVFDQCTRADTILLEEIQAGQLERDIAAVRCEAARMVQQAARLGQVLALAPQQAEQVQRIDIVRLAGEHGAVAGFSLVKTAFGVQSGKFLQHGDPLRGERARGREPTIMPQPPY